MNCNQVFEVKDDDDYDNVGFSHVGLDTNNTWAHAGDATISIYMGSWDTILVRKKTMAVHSLKGYYMRFSPHVYAVRTMGQQGLIVLK